MSVGAPYVHVSQTHVDIYRGDGHGGTDHTHIDLGPGFAHATAGGILATAKLLLTQLGFTLGSDGWRRPLDRHSPLIATAHLRTADDGMQ